MRKVILEPLTKETILISETKPNSFYLAIKDDATRFAHIYFLRYEGPHAWIFRSCENMDDGHAGYSWTYTTAIQNIVKGWTIYQFDSFMEVVQYINSLNLVRSS